MWKLSKGTDERRYGLPLTILIRIGLSIFHITNSTMWFANFRHTRWLFSLHKVQKKNDIRITSSCLLWWQLLWFFKLWNLFSASDTKRLKNDFLKRNRDLSIIEMGFMSIQLHWVNVHKDLLSNLLSWRMKSW